MSLVSMFLAPVAGRMADRFGGKYILLVGLSLWAGGMGLVLASAHPDTTRLQLLPGLLVAGFGLGMTFAPLQTIAMHNVEPRMAGAASGLINTTRQLGAVIGSAAVGALLQNQLAVKLSASAKDHASALPEQFRAQFIAGFSHATGSNLEVGAGQSGVNVGANVPEAVRKVITDTFHEGFTNAMRVSLILPIALMGVAALSCLLAKSKGRKPAPTAPAGEADAEPAAHAAA